MLIASVFVEAAISIFPKEYFLFPFRTEYRPVFQSSLLQPFDICHFLMLFLVFFFFWSCVSRGTWSVREKGLGKVSQ